MSGPEAKAVRCEIESGVAAIILGARGCGNAVNAATAAQLHQALTHALDEASCRVIILSAEGPDFCKGLDIGAACSGAAPRSDLLESFLGCLALISGSSVPVIASVEGNVTGGGVGLVAACDIVLADRQVSFMLPEVIVGMVPALITPFLLRRMTPGRIRYLAVSSRGIGAQEAKDFGLVDEVVSGEMKEALNRQIQRLFCSSPQAIAETKKYIDSLGTILLQEQIAAARNRLLTWLSRPEPKEGITAFAGCFSPPWFQKYRGKRNA